MTMINYKYLLKIGIYFFQGKNGLCGIYGLNLKKRKKLGGMEWKRDTQNHFQLSFKDEKYLKKQLCLCTMIDMGEIGCFNRNQLEIY